MEEIYYSISQSYKDGVFCEYSDDNAQTMFIRIRVDPNSQELRKLTIPDEIPLQIIFFFFGVIPECQIAALKPKNSSNFFSNSVVSPISGNKIRP